MSPRIRFLSRAQWRVFSIAAVTGLAVLAPAATAAAKPPSKVVDPVEVRRAKATPIDRIAEQADPLPVPIAPRFTPSGAGKRGEGPPLAVPGRAPSSFAPGALPRTAGAAGQNGPWPGAFNRNPNRQVGKLFFDVRPGPGTQWSSCSATAVNTDNRSTILTAGHCVYNPDPDGNGFVNGNGFWFEQVQFCPGYENGCRLGSWVAREMVTTTRWINGAGGRYDWSDDMAAIVLSPNRSGRVVDVVGGQGWAVNQNVGLGRSAFGYPEADRRWPQFRYDGQDLIHCPGRDSYASGRMFLACTMTGGASGGSWINGANASWLGFVNGVNSHKTQPTNMGSPYFGNAERDVIQYARAR